MPLSSLSLSHLDEGCADGGNTMRVGNTALPLCTLTLSLSLVLNGGCDNGAGIASTCRINPSALDLRYSCLKDADDEG